MNSNLKSNKGFTLVELLTSIVVLIAVGSVVVGIITSSLRGANKTKLVENIRQNGNYTLVQVSKNIQYSQVFNGLSNDGVDYVTNCFSPPVSPAPPSPVTTQYNYIKVTPINGNSIVYYCNSPTFTVNNTPLIDADSLSLTACSIKCTQTFSTDVPIIGISFTLEPISSNNLAENNNLPLKFETSVALRNYKK